MLKFLGPVLDSPGLISDRNWSPCALHVCYIVVLGVVRPEMAMDFGSKEVESRLMKGLSMDSPRTVFLGLLKIISICVLDRKRPCEFA